MISVVHKEEDIFSSHRTKEIRNIHPFSHHTSCLDMASIPQSYLMAKSQKKKKAAKETPRTSAHQYQESDMSSQPMCYSNKMMDSIWGQYNMYSVHNLKAVQNDADAMANVPLQMMLQEKYNQNSINMPYTSAIQRDYSGYAGHQMMKVGEPVLKNILNSFVHKTQ